MAVEVIGIGNTELVRQSARTILSIAACDDWVPLPPGKSEGSLQELGGPHRTSWCGLDVSPPDDFKPFVVDYIYDVGLNIYIARSISLTTALKGILSWSANF